jgi:hypothetical protein
MDTESVAAETAVIEAMEQKLARLRDARPHLKSRIGRAENMIVVQLSVRGVHRPVRVRVHADGSRTYAVRSGSELRGEYVIDPATWSCTCPDHRKRNAACKHSITCWVMERVGIARKRCRAKLARAS